jgi:acetyl-CoA carboxylase biotin carboxyl carrier protein
MPKLQVDKTLIRELSELLEETRLTEIEVSEGNRSVRVSRASAAATAAPITVSAPAAAPAAAEAPAAVEAADEAGAVRSPMVGTVYLAPEPGAPPFVTVGDTVTVGQTLLIIEAMKVMNQIPAPHAGTVKKVLVADAQPAEYGDILVVIG